MFEPDNEYKDKPKKFSWVSAIETIGWITMGAVISCIVSRVWS